MTVAKTSKVKGAVQFRETTEVMLIPFGLAVVISRRPTAERAPRGANKDAILMKSEHLDILELYNNMLDLLEPM